ncbi:hypothetical protein [Celeribacter sp.]|uniref:hypothetical protein n=1 Tax=Celeribacter sp. TaxID=1890673 RepID=UPI003A928D3A
MPTIKPATKIFPVLMSGFFLFGPAMSLAEEPTPCADTLSELSWTLENTEQYRHLNSDQSGDALHGLACEEDEIIHWFERHSWSFLRSVSVDGASFGTGADSYQADRGLVFCLPRKFPFRWRTNACSAQVSVLLFEGKITHLIAGPTL